MTRSAFLAAQPPIDTWSSVAALVDKESTEDGWQSTLFSETSQSISRVSKRLEFNPVIENLCVLHQPKAAAVQWAIIKPELSPPSLTRKAGSSLREGLHSLSVLLSLMEASSWTAMAKKSRA